MSFTKEQKMLKCQIKLAKEEKKRGNIIKNALPLELEKCINLYLFDIHELHKKVMTDLKTVRKLAFRHLNRNRLRETIKSERIRLRKEYRNVQERDIVFQLCGDNTHFKIAERKYHNNIVNWYSEILIQSNSNYIFKDLNDALYKIRSLFIPNWRQNVYKRWKLLNLPGEFGGSLSFRETVASLKKWMKCFGGVVDLERDLLAIYKWASKIYSNNTWSDSGSKDELFEYCNKYKRQGCNIKAYKSWTKTKMKEKLMEIKPSEYLRWNNSNWHWDTEILAFNKNWFGLLQWSTSTRR